MRRATITRKTNETEITVAVGLDGAGTARVSTGIGFFDHMLEQIARHAGITLHIETLYGANSHHIAESCFKGLARALRAAIAIDERRKDEIPSTKGAL